MYLQKYPDLHVVGVGTEVHRISAGLSDPCSVLQDSLANRNVLLEKFVAMQQQAESAGLSSVVEGEKEAWWLDIRTKHLIEQTLHLSGTLSFTVREDQPLRLTCQQVGDAAACPVQRIGPNPGHEGVLLEICAEESCTLCNGVLRGVVPTVYWLRACVLQCGSVWY